MPPDVLKVLPDMGLQVMAGSGSQLSVAVTMSENLTMAEHTPESVSILTFGGHSIEGALFSALLGF